jgi:hypothetical protein
MVVDPVVHVVVPKRVRYSGDTVMRNPRRFTNAVTGTVVSCAQLCTASHWQHPHRFVLHIRLGNTFIHA